MVGAPPSIFLNLLILCVSRIVSELINASSTVYTACIAQVYPIDKKERTYLSYADSVGESTSDKTIYAIQVHSSYPSS